jgi:hypothetical protein
MMLGLVAVGVGVVCFVLIAGVSMIGESRNRRR